MPRLTALRRTGMGRVSEYLLAVRDDDDAAVKPHLKDWLNKASRHGSGDDNGKTHLATGEAA